jgi:SAM-dependent methyltransferase
MKPLFGNHSATSALNRTLDLLRSFGVMKTLGICLAMLDDQYLKIFDHTYGVRTSGFISLSSTSFDPTKLCQATSYGPVNGWAFRRILKDLDLPHTLHFVDLGAGLGRPCILAAEHGFERVTGVELAPELCVGARENIARCRLPEFCKSRIHIIEGDILEYCDHTEDDVFFVYRPFSPQLFRRVCGKLAERAACRKKPILVIHSQRLSAETTPEVQMLSENRAFRKVHEYNMLGQSFFAYQCGAQLQPAIAV